MLVFDGCYHGTVDETLVRALPDMKDKGGTRARAGLIGMNHDVSVTTDAVPFNDIAAVERVLARSRTAAVIAEPVMTNIGMVLPEEGFLHKLRELTRRLHVLLIIDETHTLSTARGGYARAQNLEPDIWVCGKAIAGGMPCAVFGFTAEVEAGMRRVQEDRAGGHSGMGTTLSANALALACLEASLDELMTPANYQAMHDCATYLSEGLGRLFAAETLSWHVARVGARLEFGFGKPARNGAESERGAWPELEHAIHLYLLNRGVLLTPFHNMMLCSPVTTTAHADTLLKHLHACLREVGQHLRPDVTASSARRARRSSTAFLARTSGHAGRADHDHRSLRRAARQGGALRSELERIFDSGRQVAGSILGLDITGKDVDDTGLVWDTGDADMTARPIARTLTRAPWLATPTGQLMLTMFDGEGRAGGRGSAPCAGASRGAVRALRASRPWWPASSSSIY